MGSPVRSGSWIQGMQTPSQELALAKLFGYLRKPWRNLRGAGRRPVERLLQPNPLRRPTDIGPKHQVPESLFGRLDGQTGRLGPETPMGTLHILAIGTVTEREDVVGTRQEIRACLGR